MIREIVTPTDKTYTLEIPEKYINKQIEILILPLDEKENKKKKSRIYY